MKSVGVEVKPPKKSCSDSLCPFHGSLKVRGRLMQGRAVSVKGGSMAVIRRDYLDYIKKHKRYEKRISRLHAHIPPCVAVKEGDLLTVGECRPISKTISFVVLEKVSE